MNRTSYNPLSASNYLLVYTLIKTDVRVTPLKREFLRCFFERQSSYSRRSKLIHFVRSQNACHIESDVVGGYKGGMNFCSADSLNKLREERLDACKRKVCTRNGHDLCVFIERLHPKKFSYLRSVQFDDNCFEQKRVYFLQMNHDNPQG